MLPEPRDLAPPGSSSGASGAAAPAAASVWARTVIYASAGEAARFELWVRACPRGLPAA